MDAEKFQIKSSKFDFIDMDEENPTEKEEAGYSNDSPNGYENINYKDLFDENMDNVSEYDNDSIEAPIYPVSQADKNAENRKLGETKILIVEAPEEVENEDTLYILSQMPFFDKIKESKEHSGQINTAMESDISSKAEKNPEKKNENNSKSAEIIDIEDSTGDDNSRNNMKTSQKNTSFKQKVKIKDNEALKFWKSKEHCIIFTKMAMSLLCSNLGLVVLIILYVVIGACVFRRFELDEELVKFRKNSKTVGEQLNLSKETIVMNHKNILYKYKADITKNIAQLLERKNEKDMNNIVEALRVNVILRKILLKSQKILLEKLKLGSACQNESIDSCDPSALYNGTRININESIILLNNTFDSVRKEMKSLVEIMEKLRPTNDSIQNVSALITRLLPSDTDKYFDDLLKVTLESLIDSVFKATRDGWIHDPLHIEGEKEPGKVLWTYGGSVLYCITIITTIGYGHITPRTKAGRIGTIIYAIFGIPIMLICLAHIGSLMADMFRLIYRFLRSEYIKKYKKVQKAKGSSKSRHLTNSHEALEVETEEKEISVTVVKKSPFSPANNSGNNIQFRRIHLHIPNPNRLLEAAKQAKSVEVPVSLVITVFIIYNLIGSVFFSFYESWSLIDSFYFSFITLSTIGFGDLVPIATGGEAEQYKSIMCSFYVLIGLSLCVMSFDLMEKKCKSTLKKTMKKFRILISRKENNNKK